MLAALARPLTREPARPRAQNPAAPDGPRGFTAPRRFAAPDVGAGGVRPSDAESGSAALLELLLDNSRGYGAQRYNREAAAPRALAWGPPGAPPGCGGCALAVAYADGRLLLYGPPQGGAHHWQEVQDLTAAQLQRMQADNWRVRCAFVTCARNEY